ncbi:MAG TPA: phosphatidate cytidylyltransferase [Steroidobacteraceae bacterium]|jgi:phosphatidate cytidylyltransferase|nr:phosphatidate cytidylyltransferase [Steroidobacteraceae bacterium]
MLRLRILTAVALAVLLIAAILYFPASVTCVIFVGIVLIGAWEWSAFLSLGAAGRALYVAVLAMLAVLGERLTLDPGYFLRSMELALCWWAFALIWIVCAPQRGGRLAAGLAGMLTLLPTLIALVRIDSTWSNGAQWTLFILALAFAADTGAFFAGRQFGRLPLAPRVSPNKTWEGVIGGMLLAAAVGGFGVIWFRLPALSFLSLCLAAAGCSVIGDLNESLLKRHVHLKDSGRLFPGHGGMLDRIDSVTAATPVMALGLIWLGVGK